MPDLTDGYLTIHPPETARLMVATDLNPYILITVNDAEGDKVQFNVDAGNGVDTPESMARVLRLVAETMETAVMEP